MYLSLLLLFFIPLSYTQVVNVECGPVQGFNSDGVWKFLGIPYAAPPIGERRWSKTEPLTGDLCWSGTFNASQFGSMCVQVGGGQEDCLFINVWTKDLPNDPSAPKKPVSVYIHGGSLVMGSGSETTPERLAQNGLVSVTINYRLNIFGFLALSELTEIGSTGNYGFLDQIMALTWVKENIAAFGGDPNKVTIYGQSSGGTSVFALMVSPLAKGLFHRAWSMSGSAVIKATLPEAEKLHAQTWLSKTSCPNVTDILKCIYELSADEVIAAYPSIWEDTVPATLMGIPFPNAYMVPLAIVDGYVVTNSLQDAVLKPNLHIDVPFVIGNLREESDFSPVDIVLNYTSQEYYTFLTRKFSQFGVSPNEVQSYYPSNNFKDNQQSYDQISTDIHFTCENLKLAYNSAYGFTSPVYSYFGTKAPSNVFCWFGFTRYCQRYAFHTWDLLSLHQNPLFGYSLSPSDLEFGDTLLQRFISFATDGSIPQWKTTTTTQLNTNIIGETETVETDLKKDQCDFWNKRGFDNYWLINK